MDAATASFRIEGPEDPVSFLKAHMFKRNPKSKHSREDTGTADEFVSRALECLRGNRAFYVRNARYPSAVYWLVHALRIYAERVQTLEDQNRSYQSLITELRSKTPDA